MSYNKEKHSFIRQRTILAVCVALPVGLLHFVTGPSYTGPFRDFVNGYLLDILVPLSFFLLLSANMPTRNMRIRAAALVFFAASCVEVLQYYNIHLFGSTFDPLDIVMFAIGTSGGLFLDWLIFGVIRKEDYQSGITKDELRIEE